MSGWDDPRMPTLCGIRRRGYPPEAILQFCDEVGVTKRDSVVDVGLLEHFVRDALNVGSPRAMGVLRPLKVVIENFPEDRVEELDAPFHPNDPSFGSRKLSLSRVVYIERDDFMEEPVKKWFRLAPGREVRLRYACLITCVDVIVDPNSGEVIELRCTWDPESLGGAPADGRKVRGTLHWVSADTFHRSRGTALRPPLQERKSVGGRRRLSRFPEPQLARGPIGLPGRTQPRRRTPVAIASSWSDSVTSASTRDSKPRESSSSIEPWACATPGRSKRKRQPRKIEAVLLTTIEGRSGSDSFNDAYASDSRNHILADKRLHAASWPWDFLD